VDHLEVLRTLYEERRLYEARAEYGRLCATRGDSAYLHLLGALVAWRQSELREARQIAERSLSASPSGSVLGKIRFTYGVILREIGDTAAIHTLTAFIDGVWEYPELAPLMLGAGYYNLGLAYRTQGSLPNAVEAYGKAIGEFRHEGMKDHLRMALQNLAWAYCLLGDGHRSREALDEANPLCTTDHARWQQRIGTAFQAAVCGDGVRAMELCEEITQDPNGPPHDVRSHAYWLAGRTALNLGIVAQAESLARQALDVAVWAKNDNRCFGDASELLRLVRVVRISEGP